MSIIALTWQPIDPPETGGQLRTFHLLTRLAPLAVTVAGPQRRMAGLPCKRLPDLDALGFYRWAAGRVPFDVNGLRMIDPLFILGAVLFLVGRRPRVVICDSHIVFFPAWLGARLCGARLVFNSHNIVHWVHRDKAVWLFGVVRLADTLMFRLCDRLMVCSAPECVYCRDEMRIRAERILTVPNGVAIPPAAGAPENPPDDTALKTVFFVGKLGYGPNRDAVRFIQHELAPRFRHRPVMFCIVGRRPEGAERYANVFFTDYVADLRPYLDRVDVALAPIFRGAGTRLKILEYAAYGVPTVSTRKACEGLVLEGLHLAEDAEGFQEHLEALFAHGPIRIPRLRQTALAYDWDRIGAAFRRCMHRLMLRPRR